MGYVSPWRVVLTPDTSTLPECKCPSAAFTCISCSLLNSMWEAECSAPAPLHPFLCLFPQHGRKFQGHIPNCARRLHYLSKLISGHIFTVVEKSWIQSQESVYQSALKGGIAGWMSQPSASLRKVSYSSESDQLS